jgi:hypothetical protein
VHATLASFSHNSLIELVISCSIAVTCKFLTRMHLLIRRSFQKFCTLYVFSLKMNLFYKIQLQAFNVISIVFYHSGSTFGKVLYSCLDAFVFMCLITQVTSLDTCSMLLNLFPRSGFFSFGNESKSGGLSPPDFEFFRRNHSTIPFLPRSKQSTSAL